MTQTTEEFTCTCGAIEMPYTGHHDIGCDLQDHDDFYYGHVKWTGNNFEPMPSDIDPEEIWADDFGLDGEVNDLDLIEANDGPSDEAETIPKGWKPEIPKKYDSQKDTLPGPSGKQCTCKPVKLTACGLCKVVSEGVTVNNKKVYVWLHDPQAVTDWSGTSYYGGYYQKCRHYEKEVKFPDGTTVQASSGSGFPSERKKPLPDLGVYLDGIWTPKCRAYHLGWKDFGVPTVPMDVLRQILTESVTLARNGQVVEFGCVGGHGRTGTALACLAISCGVPDPAKAVEWVRDNYCKEAIENETQEWFVAFYAATIFGYEPPKKPEPKTTTSVTTWSKGVVTSSKGQTSGNLHSIDAHRKLFDEGKTCSCGYWNMDANAFKSKDRQHEHGSAPTSILSGWAHELWD